MTTGKTIALTRQTFVDKVMSLFFNKLSRLSSCLGFLPRSLCLLISWLKSPSAVILEPRKIKSDTVSTVSPSIFHELMICRLLFSSIQFSLSVMSSSLQAHGLQHARLPCLSLTTRVYSNSCPLSWWCHPTISSSVILFSSHLQSLPASGCFPVSQLFTSGSQSIGASAPTSVLPMNIQDWFHL